MTTAALPTETTIGVQQEGRAALTPRQLVALYLVLAPVPGGRWLRRLVRRHPAEAATLRQASRRWARAGSKQALL